MSRLPFNTPGLKHYVRQKVNALHVSASILTVARALRDWRPKLTRRGWRAAVRYAWACHMSNRSLYNYVMKVHR